MNATNLNIYHDPSDYREHLDENDRQPPTQQPHPPGQSDDNSNLSQEDQLNNQILDPPQTANRTGEATPPTDDDKSRHQDLDEEKLEWNGKMAQKHGNPIIVLMVKCSTKLTVNSQKMERDEKLVLNVYIE